MSSEQKDDTDIGERYIENEKGISKNPLESKLKSVVNLKAHPTLRSVDHNENYLNETSLGMKQVLQKSENIPCEYSLKYPYMKKLLTCENSTFVTDKCISGMNSHNSTVTVPIQKQHEQENISGSILTDNDEVVGQLIHDIKSKVLTVACQHEEGQDLTQSGINRLTDNDVIGQLCKDIKSKIVTVCCQHENGSDLAQSVIKRLADNYLSGQMAHFISSIITTVAVHPQKGKEFTPSIINNLIDGDVVDLLVNDIKNKLATVAGKEDNLFHSVIIRLIDNDGVGQLVKDINSKIVTLSCQPEKGNDLTQSVTNSLKNQTESSIHFPNAFVQPLSVNTVEENQNKKKRRSSKRGGNNHTRYPCTICKRHYPTVPDTLCSRCEKASKKSLRLKQSQKSNFILNVSHRNALGEKLAVPLIEQSDISNNIYYSRQTRSKRNIYQLGNIPTTQSTSGTKDPSLSHKVKEKRKKQVSTVCESAKKRKTESPTKSQKTPELSEKNNHSLENHTNNSDFNYSQNHSVESNTDNSEFNYSQIIVQHSGMYLINPTNITEVDEEGFIFGRKLVCIGKKSSSGLEPSHIDPKPATLTSDGQNNANCISEKPWKLVETTVSSCSSTKNFEMNSVNHSTGKIQMYSLKEEFDFECRNIENGIVLVTIPEDQSNEDLNETELNLAVSDIPENQTSENFKQKELNLVVSDIPEDQNCVNMEEKEINILISNVHSCPEVQVDHKEANNACGNFKCLQQCCTCCNYLELNQEFTYHSSGIMSKIKAHINCKTTNVIFIVECSSCKEQFFNFSQNSSLETCVKEILAGISDTQQNKVLKEGDDKRACVNHFKKSGHKKDDFKVYGIDADVRSKNDLTKRMRHWLNSLYVVQID